MERTVPAAPRPPQARLAVAIVGGALVRVPQHFVGLGDLLEADLGFFLVAFLGVAIGMEFHRELAVGLLDVGLRGVARHSQSGVVVAGHYSSSSSPTSRLVCSTRELILSYAMRVGPSTPITPDTAPERYGAVTSVNGARRGSECSPPIVIGGAGTWRSARARGRRP